MLNSFDGKKLIREFCLINLLVISLISLSFKGWWIYLFDVKKYLFYFDDQQIYRNGCVNPWTNLTTYQFIIFRIIVSLIFIQIPGYFSFQYIVGRLNEISSGFDLMFTIILQIYFVCDS